MPGLLRKLFGKPSKKTAAPVKQEYRPPVPHTDKERSADQNYRKRIMDQVTQLTKNAESAGGRRMPLIIRPEKMQKLRNRKKTS